MAKDNIESVIAQRKTLETLANCICCQKVYDVPYRQCYHCEDFKKCTKPLRQLCRGCAWSVDVGDGETCFPWIAHDLLTSINVKKDGDNLETKNNDLDDNDEGEEKDRINFSNDDLDDEEDYDEE